MKARACVNKRGEAYTGYVGGRLETQLLGEPRSDLQRLTELMRRQLISVPFENLDVQAGKGVLMDPEAISSGVVVAATAMRSTAFSPWRWRRSAFPTSSLPAAP
jgi:hypothetical protein